MEKWRPSGKEVYWIAALVGWSVFNFILLQVANQVAQLNSNHERAEAILSERLGGFYPFTRTRFLGFYDASEFNAYVFTAWIVFIVYYVLSRFATKKP